MFGLLIGLGVIAAGAVVTYFVAKSDAEQGVATKPSTLRVIGFSTDIVLGIVTGSALLTLVCMLCTEWSVQRYESRVACSEALRAIQRFGLEEDLLRAAGMRPFRVQPSLN